jgi:hypothetical protein
MSFAIVGNIETITFENNAWGRKYPASVLMSVRTSHIRVVIIEMKRFFEVDTAGGTNEFISGH